MEGELTLDEAVLHEQMFVTANVYDVAAVRPVTVHVGEAKVGAASHVLGETDPPEGVCWISQLENEQVPPEHAVPATYVLVRDSIREHVIIWVEVWHDQYFFL